MTPVRPAAGGGRWVEVDPARLPRWLDGFAQRHGAPVVSHVDGDGLLLVAPDGALAELHPPPGLTDLHRPAEGSSQRYSDDLAGFVAALATPRRVGLLLARQGSVAVGVGEGGRLLQSKVDSAYVQGRTAAGGWSQQRFARRRANQAKAAAGSASDLVVRLLLPELPRLTALVTGGDRRAVDAVLADRRLSGLAELRATRFLDIGEPRHAVLEQAAARADAVLIKIVEPAEEA